MPGVGVPYAVEMVRVSCAMPKFAVTEIALFIGVVICAPLIVQPFVAPLQPVNVEPNPGVAVTTALLPVAYQALVVDNAPLPAPDVARVSQYCVCHCHVRLALFINVSVILVGLTCVKALLSMEAPVQTYCVVPFTTGEFVIHSVTPEP